MKNEMNRYKATLMIAAGLLAASACSCSCSKDNGEKSGIKPVDGARYTVYMDGTLQTVHACRVSAVPFNRSWPGHQRTLDQTETAYFVNCEMPDAAKPVTFEIACSRNLNEVIVRPAELGIEVKAAKGVISFVVSHPCQFSVCVNGRRGALHVFVNGPEPYSVDKDDPGVIYFGPGEHEAGLIVPKTGQTVYLHKDAWVKGQIFVKDASNVKVLGRGVLDSSPYSRGYREGENSGYSTAVAKALTNYISASETQYIGNICFWNCHDVTVEGPVFVDSPFWSFITRNGCSDFSIKNIKIVGQWRYNSDGVDFCTTSHVTMSDSFIRSFDDAIVVRPPHLSGESTGGASSDISVQNCVVWDDWGKAMEIYISKGAGTISDVHFKDIYISYIDYAAIDIYSKYSGDETVSGSVVKNISYSGIHIDNDGTYYVRQAQTSDDQVFNYYAPGSPVHYTFIINGSFPTGTPSGIKVSYDDIRIDNISCNGNALSYILQPAPGYLTVSNVYLDGQKLL